MDDLKDRFKKSSDGFNLKPSPAVWANIEASIKSGNNSVRSIAFYFIIALVYTGIICRVNNNSTLEPTVKNRLFTANASFEKNEPILLGVANRNKNWDLSGSENSNLFNQVGESKTYQREVFKSPVADLNNSQIKSQILIGSNDSRDVNSIKKLVDTESILSVKGNSDITLMQSSVSNDKPINEVAIKPDSSVNVNTVEQITSSRSKWSFSFSLAPSVCIAEDNETNVLNYTNTQIGHCYPLNSYFKTHYRLSDAWELSSGIGLSNMSTNYNVQAEMPITVDTNTIVNLTATAFLDLPKDNLSDENSRRFTNRYSYLNLSVGLKFYCFSKSKFNVSLNSELSMNRLISYSGYTYDFDNSYFEKTNSDVLQPWILSVGGGIAFHYEFSKRFAASISPGYNYFLHSVYRSSYPVNQNFQQLELRFSLQYHLR